MVIAPLTVFGDGDQTLSVDDVAAEIMASQNAPARSDINCREVTDKQFEDLGEAFMSARHPDGEEHSTMDQMMGGEESELLKAAHIAIGRNEFGCSDGLMGDINMMSGKDGSATAGNFSMMNIGGFDLGWIFVVLFWLLALAGVIFLVKWLLELKRNESGKRTAPNILKERYARGEIDKNEFEEKKETLKQ